MNICGSVITDKIIITQVKESVYFSIVCDKTTDLAHIGQISLSVGYVDIKTCS